MSDEPKPGWCVVIDPDGRCTCRWRENFTRFPPGCKAIAIDDLLRDAATLREVFGFVYSADPENEVEVERVGLEWCARYHEYKGDAARYRWLRYESGENIDRVVDLLLLQADTDDDVDTLIDAEIARENGE